MYIACILSRRRGEWLTHVDGLQAAYPDRGRLQPASEFADEHGEIPDYLGYCEQSFYKVQKNNVIAV